MDHYAHILPSTVRADKLQLSNYFGLGKSSDDDKEAGDVGTEHQCFSYKIPSRRAAPYYHCEMPTNEPASTVVRLESFSERIQKLKLGGQNQYGYDHLRLGNLYECRDYAGPKRRS